MLTHHVLTPYASCTPPLASSCLLLLPLSHPSSPLRIAPCVLSKIGSAVVSFRGRTLRIHVLRDLAAGDEISISYVELYAGKQARQAALRSNKGFSCSCRRCEDPPADDSLLEGWQCAAGSSCPNGCVPPGGARCLRCGVAHPLAPLARASVEARWKQTVDKWSTILLGGAHNSKPLKQVAMELLPELDGWLRNESADRLCETHELRHRTFVLRSYAFAVAGAPPDCLVDAVEHCLLGMQRHLDVAQPHYLCFLHRLACALKQQAAREDGDAAAALSQKAREAAHTAAQGLSVAWGADHPTVLEWREMAAALEASAPPTAIWEPLQGFDEMAFLTAHWPGWGFQPERVAAFRREVQRFNQRMGRAASEAYQGGVRLKIRTPPFLTFEQQWERDLGDVVDVPAVRRLVADLRANHEAIVKEYSSVPDAQLSDQATHMLTSGRLWVSACGARSAHSARNGSFGGGVCVFVRPCHLPLPAIAWTPAAASPRAPLSHPPQPAHTPSTPLTHPISNIQVEAFPQQMPCLGAILKKHEGCLSHVRSKSLSQGSISTLRPGAVSKVHTGQFNLRYVTA